MTQQTRVGIIGGGQLALMLADAGKSLGLNPFILASSLEEPACRGHRFTTNLQEFVSQVDIVVFENEFVDCAALRNAASNYSVRFIPDLSVIELVQDKLNQKKVFEKLGIASPNFMELTLGELTENSVRNAFERFGPCVLKWSRMGYDGKGVMLLNTVNLGDAKHFCAQAQQRGSRVYAEEFVAFKRELAIVAAYSTRGDFVTYPVVVSEQENSICARVYGPASHFGLSEQREKSVKAQTEKLARTIGLFGTYAIEMFETNDGHILANEIAPRVHNSGHYTQDACVTSQFENHWRAVLGVPLGSVEPVGIFAMLNFLGPDKENIDVKAAAQIVPQAGARSRVHWYGKSELRPRRKMGHINAVSKDEKVLGELLLELDASKVSWMEKI